MVSLRRFLALRATCCTACKHRALPNACRSSDVYMYVVVPHRTQSHGRCDWYGSAGKKLSQHCVEGMATPLQLAGYPQLVYTYVCLVVFPLNLLYQGIISFKVVHIVKSIPFYPPPITQHSHSPYLPNRPLPAAMIESSPLPPARHFPAHPPTAPR